MKLIHYFEKFLREISLTKKQREDCINGYTTLSTRLTDDEKLKPIIVSTFLQGSFRRGTAVCPKGDKRSDVDLVVVTKLNKDKYPDPNKAMDLFEPFLKKHYGGKYRRQGHSFSIELSYVDLDLVITAAPEVAEEDILKSAAVVTFETLGDVKDWRLVSSWVPVSERTSESVEVLMEAITKETEWQTKPLWIPDRDAGEWRRTHPLEQIKWTAGKNVRCNFYYISVVKAIKWWQRINHENDRPKGYPLEHLTGLCCPDSIESVAEGVTLTLETIRRDYAEYASEKQAPSLPDHAIPENNVFERVSGEDFAKFYNHVISAAQIARGALDADTISISANKWRQLFDDKFPPPEDDGDKEEEPKGPFTIKSRTGDMTPRRYG